MRTQPKGGSYIRPKVEDTKDWEGGRTLFVTVAVVEDAAVQVMLHVRGPAAGGSPQSQSDRGGGLQ